MEKDKDIINIHNKEQLKELFENLEENVVYNIKIDLSKKEKDDE